MLSQLKAPPPHGFPDVLQLIDALNTHLQGKRYFIVIDDLWTASVWNIISRAFPREDSCSRIITTTQIDDVALECCGYYPVYIYKMERLEDDESRELFFGRLVFHSEDFLDIKDDSNEIIRKCDGLPLAIVSIASILSSESNIVRKKWKHIENSLPSTSQGRKDIVNLIYNCLPHLMYNSLPPCLRTCSLYLSMYQQGYVIKKDELVKQWVAENFLSAVQGGDTHKIAEGYFDELVNRGIVQVVDTDYNGKVLSCSVHEIVLDFLRHKSREENFIITVDYFQSTLSLPDKVRRLSIQFGGVKCARIPESIVTSHVRSLIFWGFFKCLPNLFYYGFLRVLVLHIWADQEKMNFDLTGIGKLFPKFLDLMGIGNVFQMNSFDLTGIGNLFQKSLDLTGIGKLFLLKYLKIESNNTIQLPDKIQALQHLETLQVNARLSAVPSDIVLLQRMMHLSLPSELDLPRNIGRMTSLRSLGYFDLSNNSADNVMDLGYLTNLRDLHLTCAKLHTDNLEENIKLLGSILGKLVSLKCLTLAPNENILADAGAPNTRIRFDGLSINSLPPDLQTLELSRHCCIFSRLPDWIGYLFYICILKVAVVGLSREDIDVLKKLPSLAALTLYIQTAASDRIVIDKGGFQVLTYFKFTCAAPHLSFVQGAMPKVEKLKLGFNSNEWRSHTFDTVGFHYLTDLTEVSVKFGARDAEEFDIKTAESTLEAAVRNHKNTPTIRVQFVDVILCAERDNNTAREDIQVGKKTTELWEERENKRQEIQEGKKKITESSEEHVNRQDESRYSRTDYFFTALMHHTQSVDLLTGASNTLLHLLPKLIHLQNKYTLQTDLYKELEALQAVLHKVVKLEQERELEADHRDEVLKAWARDARDLSYDAEDIIDSLSVEASEPYTTLIQKTTALLSRGKALHEISDDHDINDISGQIAANPKATASFDPPLLAMYEYPLDMVGINVPRDEVIRMLTDETGVFKKLKIVSILGIGGLGKTTLVKAVYDKIRVQYDRTAFVSVSRDSDIRKLYMDILLQIGKHKTANLSLAEGQLIKEVRRELVDKRYLIVMDDIWDVESWERIKPVLVYTGRGSRVLTTTQILDVAKIASEVYELKALSGAQSKELFNARFYYGEKKVLNNLPEVLEKLLLKCGGVPLAIITMASLLVRKPMNDWSKVYNNIGLGSEVGGSTDATYNTRETLLCAYYDLSYPLRASLLYLHNCAVNCIIKKETLIWKWAAEGFIVEEPGTGLFELGERYIMELINRNLVMPVEDDLHPGKVIGCRTHDLVTDMICSSSIEENFVTVVDGSKQPPFESKARRLSVQKWAVEQADSLSNIPERLRSFNTTGCLFSVELSLSRFKLLRVLALEECSLLKGNLSHLGMLLLLRYLGLYNTPISELPEEIGGFTYLQTLDLRGTNVKEFPRGFAQLRQLKCLRADKGTKVPDLIGNLTSLEELRLGMVAHQIDSYGKFFVTELGKLTELRELEIQIGYMEMDYYIKKLVQSMRKLEKIQVLRLMHGGRLAATNLDLGGFDPPLLKLRELHLSNIKCPGLPPLITVSRVPMLSYLSVYVKSVKDKDLEILGALPELVGLELLTMSYVNVLSIEGGAAFPRLRFFNTFTPYTFQPGAMPRLETLRFGEFVPAYNKRKVTSGDYFDASMGNLVSLQELEVGSVDFSVDKAGDVKVIHEAARGAVDKHPNHPSLRVLHEN